MPGRRFANLRVACRCGEKASEGSPSDAQTPLVVQENHYDPFGLDLTGLNKVPDLTANWFKYIDRELQEGLGWYDLQARFYDPANGRFLQIDPVTESQEYLSTYQYGWNNPILNRDPDGKCPNCITALAGGLIKGGVELGAQLLSGKSFEQVDWADVGVEFVKGAVIGSGAGAITTVALEVSSVAVKASIDASATDGVKSTFNGRKSVSETAFDASVDVISGKIAGTIAKGANSMLANSVKSLTDKANAATRAAFIAKSYVNETARNGTRVQAQAAANYAKRIGQEATIAKRVNQTVSVAAQIVKSEVGTVVRDSQKNRFTDAVKKFFGF